MTKFYVYLHRFSNGSFYIGKGSKNRLTIISSRGKYWKNLANKYGVPIAGIYRDGLTEQAAFELEVTLISLFKEANIHICNITNGGEGTSGYVFTDADKLKLRLNRPKGLKPSLGKRHTQEHKDKIRNALKGKPKKEGTSLQHSIRMNGDHYKVTHIKTGQSWIVTECWTPWCKETGLSPTHLREVALNKNNRTQHKGYTAMIIPKSLAS